MLVVQLMHDNLLKQHTVAFAGRCYFVRGHEKCVFVAMYTIGGAHLHHVGSAMYA